MPYLLPSFSCPCILPSPSFPHFLHSPVLLSSTSIFHPALLLPLPFVTLRYSTFFIPPLSFDLLHFPTLHSSTSSILQPSFFHLLHSPLLHSSTSSILYPFFFPPSPFSTSFFLEFGVISLKKYSTASVISSFTHSVNEIIQICEKWLLLFSGLGEAREACVGGVYHPTRDTRQINRVTACLCCEAWPCPFINGVRQWLTLGILHNKLKHMSHKHMVWSKSKYVFEYRHIECHPWGNWW